MSHSHSVPTIRWRRFIRRGALLGVIALIGVMLINLGVGADLPRGPLWLALIAACATCLWMLTTPPPVPLHAAHALGTRVLRGLALVSVLATAMRGFGPPGGWQVGAQVALGWAATGFVAMGFAWMGFLLRAQQAHRAASLADTVAFGGSLLLMARLTAPAPNGWIFPSSAALVLAVGVLGCVVRAYR